MTEKKKVVKNFDHLVHEKAGALRGGERPQKGSAKTIGFAEGEASPYKKNCISSSYFCILLPTPEKVVLRIAIRASGAVLLAKAMREQGIPEDGGNFFSINCIVNFELKREMASKFGERLVLEPESLRNEIIDDVKKMMDRYGEIKPVH